MSLVPYLHKVVNRENLEAAEAEQVMNIILAGEATQAQIAGFLVALRMKGESPEELLGLARAMRLRAARVQVDTKGEPLLDTCGTGGDGACTFNISTVAAFVAAGAGLKVAKHGNRSVSSRCGSADILEALGVNILAPPEIMAAAIREIGIGFFFAPAIHPAMQHAVPARSELKLRTVFNLLGPLTNPAGATAQLAGAPSIRAAELMASALAALGLPRGFVVHGLDGLDEITTTAETFCLEIRGGAIADTTLSPADFGVSAAAPSDLKGQSREENSLIAREILSGKTGAKRDVVLVNASAALVAGGRAKDFRHGVELAARAIDSGAAMAKLEALAAYSTAAIVNKP